MEGNDRTARASASTGDDEGAAGYTLTKGDHGDARRTCREERGKGLTWKSICEAIGGYSPVLIVGALLGQMKLTKPQAAKAAELFGLSNSERVMLNETPMRGACVPMPPTDPLIYRFYELVMVNGPCGRVGL